ncbi:hypothetical protein TanjilG_18776 [Lupinus angustifolius]|uniref:Stress induced protein n=1 Tax=Lupinus angustifolius TaxID=3871 RepID=A0A1J7H9U3_LUPAN|nr:PREDICTED: uncharacterized protein LOC109326471 [Lupinus angustifolius]OIV98492.1 hypothetical protein TanjilG_18776 [Lupinus angustifolius]
MSSFEEKPLVEAMEHEDEDFDDHYDSNGCGYGCFRLFRWQRHHGEGKGGVVDQKGESFFISKLRKIKEASEVIAGPKWKTFIRKMSCYGKKIQKNRFQYDQRSYALNFNADHGEDDQDVIARSFSIRFIAPFPPGRTQTEP